MHPNITRTLAQSCQVNVREWHHKTVNKPIKSPIDFAAAIGYDLDRISKTVVLANKNLPREARLQNRAASYAAVCLSASRRTDLAIVAAFLGWAHCEIATPHELSAVTDYPSKGVSPLGLGPLRVVVDDGLLSFSTILIGAGEVGVEIEISPHDLMRLSNSTALRIAENR
jgi:Cys-tRNA(Pro)/Cys-tRNA(Cys) deacylase